MATASDPEPEPGPEPGPGPALELLLEVDGAVEAEGGWLADEGFVADWARHALGGAHASRATPEPFRGARHACHELSVRLVPPETMRALNRDWRGRDAPTNVLSFPSEMPPLEPRAEVARRGAGRPGGDRVPVLALGDLVICPAVVRAEARAQGKALAAHWAHLIVHGVLHLVGHDHVSDEEARSMEALETRLLGARDLPDPYGARAPSSHE